MRVRRRHAVDLELALLDRPHRHGEVDHHDRDLPGDDVGHRRHAAAIRHVLRLGADLLQEHFHEQMVRRRCAGGAVAHLAVLAFDQLDQVRQRRRADVRVGDQRELRRADEADRREVLHRVVGQLLVDARPDRQRRHRREKQRVAVGRRFARRRWRRSRVPAPTRLSTMTGLLELVLQLRRQQAHQDVGAAAGRERADEGHGPARIVVGLRTGALAAASEPIRKHRASAAIRMCSPSFGCALSRRILRM